LLAAPSSAEISMEATPAPVDMATIYLGTEKHALVGLDLNFTKGNSYGLIS